MTNDGIEEFLAKVKEKDEKLYTLLKMFIETKNINSLYFLFTYFNQYLNIRAIDYFKMILRVENENSIYLAKVILHGHQYYIVLRIEPTIDLNLEW